MFFAQLAINAFCSVLPFFVPYLYRHEIVNVCKQFFKKHERVIHSELFFKKHESVIHSLLFFVSLQTVMSFSRICTVRGK